MRNVSRSTSGGRDESATRPVQAKRLVAGDKSLSPRVRMASLVGRGVVEELAAHVDNSLIRVVAARRVIDVVAAFARDGLANIVFFSSTPRSESGWQGQIR